MGTEGSHNPNEMPEAAVVLREEIITLIAKKRYGSTKNEILSKARLSTNGGRGD